MSGSVARRFRRSVAVVLTISFGVVGTIADVQVVHAANPVTQVMADGIETLSMAIGATTALGELAEAIPLTGVSPALADGLDVLTSLQNSLATLNDSTNAFIDQAPGDVASILEGLDTPAGPGVKLVVGCDGGCDAGETPVSVTTDGTTNVTTLVVPVTLSRTISTPVNFQSSVVDLDGGTVSVTLSASAELHLAFDADLAATQPDRALAVQPFTVTYAAVLTSATDITASTRLGIADATATLKNLGVTLGLTQHFSDPDGVGGITVEELKNTTIGDLTQIGRTGSVTGDLNFDTDLIPGAPDTPDIDIGDTDLSNGYSFTLPALDNLSPFTLITPEALVAGIGQSAAALGGAQASTDPNLPFLKGTLRRLTAASRPVLDVVDSLGVICGTAQTEGGTPSGGAEDLEVGITVYCQAIVTTGVQPGSVTWTSDSGGTAGANTGGPTAIDTLGLAPTKNAVFVTTAAGDFQAHVGYTASIDDDNNSATPPVLETGKRSERPPRSVQQLAAKVASLGGFDNPTDLVGYDPATKALTFHISKTFDGPSISLPIDAGDQLEAETGIAGLTTTGGGINASADDISIDFTPGVLLLPESEWPLVTGPDGCPDPGISPADVAAGKCISALDLFFVKVNADSPEFSIGDATFTASSPTLRGQLGYLGVAASVTSFGIQRSNTTEPVLSVDLVPTGNMQVDGTTLTDAIRLRELLFSIADHVDVSPLNLKLNGALTVSATLNGSPVASAGVTIAWDPVATGSPTITPSASFQDLFASFNPVPNLFGSHTGADSTTVLANGTANFSDSAVGTTLDNLTDGSSCTVGSFTATSLTCQEPLAGGTDNTWQSGDAYRLHVGSPLAMLEILLDNIDQITKVIQNLTGVDAAGALDTKLPVVGISPRDLLGQIDDLRQALAEIKGTGASVQCGLSVVGGALQGDPSQVTLDDTGHGSIFCAGVAMKPALDDPAPVWTVDGPINQDGATATVVAPGTPAASVGSTSDPATSFVEIQFTGAANQVIVQHQEVAQPDGSTVTTGYRVQLGWSDVDGAHAEEYPSLAQPTTLQALEEAVKDKLGISEGFGLALVDGPDAGQKLVTIDLNIGRCNDATLCPGDPVNMDALSSPINADVDGLGGLVAAGGDGQVDVKYSASARIKIGLDLSGTPQIYVMPTTGISLKGRFEATSLNFDATLGPFSIKAGTHARLNDQGDADPANDVYDGNGTVKLGADLTIGSITEPVALTTFLGSLGTYLTPTFTAPPDQSCGTVTTDETTTPPTTVELTAMGCGLISVGVSAGTATNYVADLGLTVDLTAGEFTITPYIPADLAAKFASAALDIRLLLNALPPLLGELKDGLRASGAAAAGNGKLPLIGDALDAGADVAGELQTLTQGLVDLLDPIVSQVSEPNDVIPLLQNMVYDNVPHDFLKKPNGDPIEAATDIEVYLDCGDGLADSCADGASLLTMKDLRVVFAIGQTATTALPFDLGLDGVPLRLAGTLAPSVGWSFVIDLGLSRETGPYIGVGKPLPSSGRPDAELTLQADIGFGEDAGACSAVMSDPLSPLSNDTGSIIEGDWSGDRCLGGQLAFLGVQVRDGNNGAAGEADTKSHATVRVGLDVSNGSESTLGLTNIGDVKLQPVVGIDTALNLRFRTGIVGGQDAGFPELVGTFHMAWAWNKGEAVTAPTVGFDDIHLNLQPLLGKFIEPIANEVRKITGPFKPVIDTLTAPIPVVSDLAELVGQPPVTLLGLMQAISGNDLTLIQSLAAFIQFINDPKVAEGYIPLDGLGGGGFNINGAKARLAQGPTEAAKLVQGARAAAGSLLKINPKSATGGTTASTMGTAAAKPAPVTKAALPGTFGVPGLTFPFIDNPSSIFGLMMGQDITLVRYDVGPLQATAGFSYNFPPIMVGPIPIAIGVGGSVTVKGRFVIGYDTSGLRKVLSGGSGMYLFDGIFLDDLDINGVDVPEVSFIGEVYAQAGVSIGIASAGIVAGLRITVDLNLDDSPSPDGKLHIEEIFNKLSNPICLFDVAGSLTAFIKAYVEINLFITSFRYDFTLLELELLKFSGKCTPPKPELAHFDGSVLVLNVGLDATKRNVDEENEDEEMTVRPAGHDRYSVTGFGLHQTFGPGAEFNGPAITAVRAVGGNGDDKFQMLPGADETNPEAGGGVDTSIPFTVQAFLYGEGDNDVLVGGDADDTLQGGNGNDRVQGGKGVDHIDGGADVDTLNGDPGNDIITGGAGDDQIQTGSGDDWADGGDGNDLLQGGPGTDKDLKQFPDATDGNDTLIGGPGIDTVDGGLGDDHVYGDAETPITTLASCQADAALPVPVVDVFYDDKVNGGIGTDVVVGGLGNDELYGGAGNDAVCGNQGNDKLDGDQNGDPKAGIPGDDMVAGGSGADVAVGGEANDLVTGDGGADSVDGQAGNDDVIGGTGRDLVRGGDGRDIIAGDTALVAQGSDKALRGLPASLIGLVSNIDTTLDTTAANCGYDQATADGGDTAGRSDCMFGDAESDLVYGEGGNDQIFAGDGDDLVRAGVGDDNPVHGDAGADTMYGEAGNDWMYGDSGADTMYGNADSDTMRGGIDDDLMEGNEATDAMFGEGGQDDIIGGSSADGVADAADGIDGGAASDVIVGDNGAITRPGGNDTADPTSVARAVTVYDVNDPSVGGGDIITGGLSNDRILGGNAGDTIFGESGVDRIEGNDGLDHISGGNDDDRLVGGSSAYATLKDADGTSTVPYDQAPDVGDVVSGNDGADVLAGDDASITFDGLATMTVFDTAASHGDDELHGNAGQDRIYGQLGADTITGDADQDYAIGDLGAITPAAPTGTWPGGAPIYTVRLQLVPDSGGIDTIDGGVADDHLYGGAANDVMTGGSGDDVMEGNGGRDSMYGWASGQDTLPGGLTDQDDMIGGSSAATRPGDIVRADEGELIMQGNADHDVMTGDNADIVRGTTAAGTLWAPDEVIAGAVKRTVTLLDRERTDLSVVSGGDVMVGNTGSDRMFGEGSDDSVKGNESDDLLEGNQGNDWLEGNSGEDDLVGGSSFLASAGGAALAGAGTDLGDPDGVDALFGGDNADVMVGDNAVIVRKTAGNSAAYAAGQAAAYFTTDPTDGVPGWWLGVTTDRQVRLLDRSTSNTGRYGSDLLLGGLGADVAFGQDGNDWVGGGANDDALEGNGGADTLLGDATPGLDGQHGEPVLATPPAPGTAAPERDGGISSDGEDDIVGGSNVSHRDGNDTVGGNGEDDFVLGDNGTLQRNISGAVYVKYAGDGASHDRIMRRAIRLDVGAAPGSGVYGADTLRGNAGDDAIWGQDGNDTITGGADADDLLGELGNDIIWGGTGEDAIVGDRGSIRNTELGAPGAQFSAPQYSFNSNGPPFLVYTGLRPGTFDRRVDLKKELAGSVGGPFTGGAVTLTFDGVAVGGNDTVRGGPDHDSIHGASGDDLLNGDSGGDTVFGGDGSDLLWGGRGSANAATPDIRGTNDSLVDYVFGGAGGNPNTGNGIVTGGADIIDYQPRVGIDPQSWFDAVAAYASDGDGGSEALRQHHQGVDWMYGGWDRDVMESNVAANGPNDGDRAMDWTGSYNLYVQCPSNNGGYNDLRAQSPSMIAFLENLAFSLGVGNDIAEVRNSTSSAYDELALVYKPDVKSNSGGAYPTTPGHFENPNACNND